MKGQLKSLSKLQPRIRTSRGAKFFTSIHTIDITRFLKVISSFVAFLFYSFLSVLSNIVKIFCSSHINVSIARVIQSGGRNVDH